jgi:hypothetical protein
MKKTYQTINYKDKIMKNLNAILAGVGGLAAGAVGIYFLQSKKINNCKANQIPSTIIDRKIGDKFYKGKDLYVITKINPDSYTVAYYREGDNSGSATSTYTIKKNEYETLSKYVSQGII